MLRQRLGADIEVLNAGVAGYGPADALDLLGYLVEEGYRFDAAVLGLFLENDFTDNLPGTQRRVVAGINFRFPASPWLRLLHPMNSRTFRYAIFGVQAGRLRAAQDDFATRGDGRCRPPPPLADPLPGGLESLVRRRLETNYALPAPAPGHGGGGRRTLGPARPGPRPWASPWCWCCSPIGSWPDRELRDRLALPRGAHDLGAIAPLGGRRGSRDPAGGHHHRAVLDVGPLPQRRHPSLGSGQRPGGTRRR